MNSIKRSLNLLAASIVFFGCAGPEGARGPKGEVVTIPAPTPTLTAEETLVNSENEYRLAIGQAALRKGLSCTLYTITGGNRIQSGANTLTGISQVGSYGFIGEFNQPNTNISAGLNVLPDALKSVYKNMFLLRCTGQIVITSTGYHSFSVSSDDASLLYIGGSLVVDNDNGHGITTVTGSKFLRQGVYSFRLDFAQSGGGDQALIVKMDGNIIDRKVFYY